MSSVEEKFIKFLKETKDIDLADEYKIDNSFIEKFWTDKFEDFKIHQVEIDGLKEEIAIQRQIIAEMQKKIPKNVLNGMTLKDYKTQATRIENLKFVIGEFFRVGYSGFDQVARVHNICHEENIVGFENPEFS